MDTYDLLEISLKQILSVIKPPREDFVVRAQIIDDFRAVVESVDSLRGATVEPFGSFCSNLFSRWGDLDISIELQNGSFISAAAKKRKQALLGDLLKVLRRMGGWHKLRLISNARIPILKMESARMNISCDISINNLTGQMKSKILYWISEIDDRYRDMVLLVKEWAKVYDINNSRNGSFNSYCLCLLIIFHFQTCVPAIFPPLRDIYPGNIDDELQGVRDVVERNIAETCVANIQRFRSDRLRIPNRSSLSELFISFLAKFSDISVMAEVQGICTFTGHWEEVYNQTRWLPRTYALFVEDPFHQPTNAARTVSAREMERIAEVFRATHRRLILANQNQSSLISALVKPEIAQLITPPTTQPNGFNNMGYGRARPQVIRGGFARTRSQDRTSQVQHQFQNMRLESRVNNGHNYTITQRPVQSRANHTTAQRHVQSPANHTTGQRLVQSPANHTTAQRPVLSQTNHTTTQRPVQSQAQPQRVWRPRIES